MFVAMPSLTKLMLPTWVGQSVDVLNPLTGEYTSGLPLSQHEAELVLREWQARTPEELRREILHNVASMQGDDGLFPKEEKAISLFCDNFGENTHNKKANVDDVRRRAQRLLLLALAQEQRVHELNSITNRYAEQEARLARLLSEDDDDIAPVHFESNTSSLLPSWRFVLTSAAWFLPLEAILVVTDPLLAAELMFKGNAVSAEGHIFPNDMFGQMTLVEATLNCLLNGILPETVGDVKRIFLIHN